MGLFLALYMNGVLSGIVDAPRDREACDMRAVSETVSFAARGDIQFTVKCEEHGPNSTLWQDHPEWKN